jgi:tight adherence protein B
MVEQAGLDLTPSRLLTIAAGTSIALGVLGGLIRQSLLVAAVGAALGAILPVFYVNIKRNARLEKLLSQLPDAFDLMSRVIRAGQTMSQGLLAVADEFSPPIAGEFAFCYEQQNLGLPPETALRELARRTGLLELKIFVLAMLIQQQTGGNLAELLDKLSHIIRERYKMRGKVKALTAEGRMQAMVLLGLPPFMFVLMLAMNRTYAGVLLDHPAMLWGTLISESMGALWIRKIVNFDF